MNAPIFSLKSGSGEVLIQGSAEQVKAWYAEKRITNSDEFSRQGWKLHENDEAWATIQAFPEIYGPSAWKQLRDSRRRNKLILVTGIAVLLIGILFITLSQLLPAVDVASKTADSAESARKALQNLDFAQKQVASMKSFLAEAVKREGDLRIEKSALIQKVTRLEKQIDSMQNTLPVFVRWRDSSIGSHKVMVFANTSNVPLKLLVSIYDSNNVQTTEQFVTSLEPVSLAMSVKESGFNEKVNHQFKLGEYAEFTDVDTGKAFRYYPVKFRCE